MDSLTDITALTVMGFPIRKSPDQRMFSSSPKLIAAYHVLLRRLAPRHPPSALIRLATIFVTSYCFYALVILLRSLLDAMDFQRFSANLLRLTTTHLTANKLKMHPRQSRSVSLMVEDSGIEPLTSCVQGRRSPS